MRSQIVPPTGWPIFVTAALAVLLGGCGGEPARECLFNSNCAAGRYCTPAGMCIADCTPEGGECGAGASCNSFGMCVALDDGGSMPDAFVEPVDAFLWRPDVGVDAGLDAAVPVVEVCTPSVAGASVGDEDADGLVDEGCVFELGRAHWVSRVAVTNVTQWFPRLSSDGLRLYTGVWDWSRAGGAGFLPYVAERTTTHDSFGPARPVLGAFEVGSHIAVMSPRSDELEAFVQVDFPDGHREIHRTRRDALDQPWGAPAGILTEGGSYMHPALSSDGLTLYFTDASSTPARLRVTTRASWTDSFGPSSMVSIEGLPAEDHVEGAWPTDDGTLLFSATRAGFQRLYRAPRLDSAAAFGAAEELASLSEGDGYLAGVSYHSATRELWFTSNRAWSAGGQWADGTRQGGIWRAQVCRNGPCAAQVVECAAGVRSADQLHCYTRTASASTQMEGDLACRASGAFLATIHSAAEREAIWRAFSVSTGGLWTGGTDATREGVWTWLGTGEPLIFTDWAATEPNGGGGENGLVLWSALDGRFADITVEHRSPYVCERELWPTW